MPRRTTTRPATGLTAAQWTRLIKFFRAAPDHDPDKPQLYNNLLAANAARNRTTQTLLPIEYLREARRVAQYQLRSNSEPPR